MLEQTSPQQLTLAGIAHRCAEESERFFRRQQHDPIFCYELFRRAIVERNQQAWDRVYHQYRPLVSGWIDRHSSFHGAGEEVQYFVNRAFEQMWYALTAEKFERFPDLKSLLRYLQMCVHSSIIDLVRSSHQPELAFGSDEQEVGDITPVEDVESKALDGLRAKELWGWINAQLQDEKERLVVHGSFALALKPREIFTLNQQAFRSVDEVYRVKENVLSRLRRAPELKTLFEIDA